jgi:hypothetical protein
MNESHSPWISSRGPVKVVSLAEVNHVGQIDIEAMFAPAQDERLDPLPEIGLLGLGQIRDCVGGEPGTFGAERGDVVQQSILGIGR